MNFSKNFIAGSLRTPKFSVTPKGGGFTLIELLVVIAIIGVLASVVLVSLTSARTKGADAAVKSNLTNTKVAAALYYDSGSTYAGVCAVGAGTINAGVLAAVQATNLSGTVGANMAAQTAGNGACHDNATAWVAQAPLKSGGHWCVDSTGASKTNASLLGGVTACP